MLRKQRAGSNPAPSAHYWTIDNTADTVSGMISMPYEAHITASRDYADRVRFVGESFGWKYSQIDGDPVMGDGVKCYLSFYGTDAFMLLELMRKVAEALKDANVPVLRTKVEAIIFDDFSGVNRIEES